MFPRIRKKISDFLYRQGFDHPEIRWMVGMQSALALGGIAFLAVLGLKDFFWAFATGALLATFNFSLLARLVPKLIFMPTGALFSLLFGFFIRFLFTAGILCWAIVWARLPVVVLLTGLSTVLMTFILWGGKFVWAQNHKEA